MSRWASSANEAEAAQPSVTLVVLADLDFPTERVRVHDGIGPLTFNGHEYLGVGQFGGLELDAEDAEVAAKGAKLTLSGIPGDMAVDVLTEVGYQGRDAVLYIGLLDQETNEWIDPPEELWSGQMDFIDVPYSDETVRAELLVEDELRREPTQAWYTDEDQQMRFAGDRFFSDLPNVEIYNAVWGRAVIGGGAYGGGGGGSYTRYPRPVLER